MIKVGDMLPRWWLDNMMTAEIRVHNRNPEVPLPAYSHGSDQDAGMDLISVENVLIGSGEIVLVDTGLNLEIPSGIVGEVRSRSGLASRGIVVNNSPGTIDPSYRGPVKVILRNQSPLTYQVKVGDRIAQIVFVPYIQVSWCLVKKFEDLSDSVRGGRGMGSTGLMTEYARNVSDSGA